MAYSVVKWHEKRKRYFGEYKDAKGKRRTVFEKKQKDCIAKLRKAEREVDAGIHTPKSDTVTFGVALDAYIADCERRQRLDDMSPSTVAYYRGTAELHVRPELGAIRLDKLTTYMCQDLVDRLQDEYKAVAEVVRKILRGTLETAVRREWLSRNPLTDRKLKVIKRKPEIQIPTKGDLRDVVEFVMSENAPMNWRLMVMLPLFAGGMRRGELYGLRWQDIDWLAGKIRITHSVCATTHKLKKPKTPTSRRDVTMIPVVRNIMAMAWEAAGRPQDGFIITTSTGGNAYEAHTYQWSRLMLAAGVVDDGKPRFTIHALRHACVSLLAEKRTSLVEVARFVGHKTTEMTAGIYAHLFADATDTITPALTSHFEALIPAKNAADLRLQAASH